MNYPLTLDEFKNFPLKMADICQRDINVFDQWYKNIAVLQDREDKNLGKIRMKDQQMKEQRQLITQIK